VYEPVIVSVPAVDEVPKEIRAAFWTLALMLPLPDKLPPKSVTRLAPSVPPASVVLALAVDCVNVPVVVKLLPVPRMLRLPVLLNAACVVKDRPFCRVRLPVFELRFARALLPDWSMMREFGPSSTMVAAFVPIAAPANWNVPPIK